MWDGTAYAANTAHHRAFDAGFLSTLGVAAGDRVLDLGCGVGDLTCLVADLVSPAGEVVGLDAEPTMIEVARSCARANQSFVVAPAQSVASAIEGPFDVIYSRAVLHWLSSEDLASVLVQAFSLLRPGGVLRIECGGGGNVPEIVAFLDDVGSSFGRAVGVPWNFRDPGWWLDLLLSSGYSVADDAAFVRTVAQRRRFDRDSLLGWLRSQCLHAYEPSLALADRPAFRALAESRIDELQRPDGSYDLTFVRLDALVTAAAG
ncbi:MAG: trans-aconitate 2-methyltransferase [Actinomycetota bacterium]|jgi:trans-aconitate methyltransferase|nr:trans-aconitate 2-methyltransferase [Actinomycetota bacterium]